MKIGNLEVYGVIYKIENKVNGKVYIGQTTNKRGFYGRYNFDGVGVERVYKYYCFQKEKGYKFNQHLLSAIEKYGLNSFNVYENIDFAFSRNELDVKEQCWIHFYNSYYNGYNNCLGGRGSLGNKGKYNPLYGKSIPKERKIKISKATKGVPKPYVKGDLHWTRRCGFSEKTLEKMSKSHRDVSGENNPMYGMRGDKCPSSKKVICITTGKTFVSAREGAKYYKCDESGVIKCCRGKLKSCGKLNNMTKLVWKYL
ncbi:NUMOD3 domain-containing DNA-binding protein [Clostridium sporogenes]